MSFITIRKHVAGQADTPLRDVQVPVTGDTLAQAIYLSGLFPPPALCSGLGHCGRCRVRFLSDPPSPVPGEEAVLNHHAFEQGWRLACRHKPLAGMHVELPPASLYGQGKALDFKACPPLHASTALLAVDLGTTSLHWQGLAATTSGATGSGMEINPQMGAGSDIMSRLAYAAKPGGCEKLQALVLAALTRIAEHTGGALREMCLAANPGMTYIALGKDSAGLATAPYRLEYAGGCTEILPGLPPVWIPPQLSPFVGGDTSAGYAALAWGGQVPEYPFLLADLGTNGEFVLALSPDTAIAASVPMGPALEGINLHFGTEARPGAVTGFRVTPNGLEPEVMGDRGPVGISGTGYLSLVQCLLAVGLLQQDGSFSLPGRGKPLQPLAIRVGSAEQGVAADGAQTEARLRLPGRMFLTASDVEELLKVKAAFSLAVSRLLAEASLSSSHLKVVYFSGALGEHIPQGALESLGFLPPGLEARVRSAGNTSLAGAALLLRTPALRDRLCSWASGVRTLDLATDKAFTEGYASHMIFTWNS